MLVHLQPIVHYNRQMTNITAGLCESSSWVPSFNQMHKCLEFREHIVCITCLIKHLRKMNRFHKFLLCAANTSLFRHGCSNMKRQDNDPKKITVPDTQLWKKWYLWLYEVKISTEHFVSDNSFRLREHYYLKILTSTEKKRLVYRG